MLKSFSAASNDPSHLPSMKNHSSREVSRRQFLKAASAVGGSMLVGPAWLPAADEADPRVTKLVAGTLGIDTHNHIDVPQVAADVPGPDLEPRGRDEAFELVGDLRDVRGRLPAARRAGPGVRAVSKRAHLHGRAAHPQPHGARAEFWKASWSASKRRTSEGYGCWTCSTTATPRCRWAISTRHRLTWAG